MIGWGNVNFRHQQSGAQVLEGQDMQTAATGPA
jgi:hypothetical protein